MTKTALIIGITGQDGSYLAELLLSKGYEVHGLVRRSSTFNTARINHLYEDPHTAGVKLLLHYADLSTLEGLPKLLDDIKPNEIYNLGAQSHVQVSFEIPIYTGDVTGLSSTRLLEAVRNSGISTRVYQAGSSEMFGTAPAPQDESSQFNPQSPYAASKLFAHWNTKIYRESFGLFASNGILFNHESPRRGETFVTRKITMALAKILAGKQDALYLGNLDAIRDWGYAPEYVSAMWKILQQDEPDDFVIGTGSSYSIRDFLDEVFTYAGLNWHDYVKFDPRYLRPSEVPELRASPEKSHSELGWDPKIDLPKLVRIMVDADLASIGLDPVGEGAAILDTEFDSWHTWESSVMLPIKYANK
jgi:GDPmannose 4,6-dehydratase